MVQVKGTDSNFCFYIIVKLCAKSSVITRPDCYLHHNRQGQPYSSFWIRGPADTWTYCSDLQPGPAAAF